MVAHDFSVYYEAVCEPYTESCFVYCEEDDCSEPSYYKEVIRGAAEVLAECGRDVSQCQTAGVCGESEEGCEVTYCDPGIEGNMCDGLSTQDPTAGETSAQETGNGVIEQAL